MSSGPTFKDYLLSSRPGLSRHLLQATFAGILCIACAPGVAESGLDEAARLSSHVEEMYARGQYADAIPIASRALQLGEKALGPKHPELVVLSACETGSGDVVNGEGVYGLRRALVLAGAQSQLVSLWKVSDAATEALMREYYQRLTQREGRAQALRSAQQMMQSKPATAHPFYWAAFVPIGNWQAVQGR